MNACVSGGLPEGCPGEPGRVGRDATMHSKRELMDEFRRRLEPGSIQAAYRDLLSYMSELRTRFASSFGESAVSGLYQGYMDITFFALFPPSLRQRQLKVAIVFNYDAFRFEAWLAGRNREVQRRCWELLKDAPWPGFRVRAPAKDVDSILECDLATDFDLDDPDALTARIETSARAFIDRIEQFLVAGQAPQKRAAVSSKRRRS